MQANWIGKSIGLEIRFPISQTLDKFSEIKVFTTRPDTLLGASFIGISPDHPLAKHLEQSNEDVAQFNVKCKSFGNSQQDIDKAEKVYQGYKALEAKDIADIIEFVINRPSHVNIADILVLPQAQATSSIIKKNNI